MADRTTNQSGGIGSELVRENILFADIVSQFVAGLGERVRQMEDAIQTADFAALQVAAHHLKGTGGGYGYPILSYRAAQLEEYASEQALDQCLDSIEELKGLCEQVVVDYTE